MLRKKRCRFFNGKNNIDVWSRLKIVSTTSCSIHRSLCTPYQSTTVWLIIPADTYGRYIVTRAQNKYVRCSVNDGFAVRRNSHTEYIRLISASSSWPRFDRMATHPEIGGRINPCNVQIKMMRSINVWTTSCHRAAVEVAVKFRSHSTRIPTWILADKNTFDSDSERWIAVLFPRREGLSGRRSRRKVARSLCGLSRYKKCSFGAELVREVHEAGRKVAADHRNKKRHRCNDRELSLTRHLMI